MIFIKKLIEALLIIINNIIFALTAVMLGLGLGLGRRLQDAGLGHGRRLGLVSQVLVFALVDVVALLLIVLPAVPHSTSASPRQQLTNYL